MTSHGLNHMCQIYHTCVTFGTREYSCKVEVDKYILIELVNQLKMQTSVVTIGLLIIMPLLSKLFILVEVSSTKLCVDDQSWSAKKMMPSKLKVSRFRSVF